MKLVSWNGNNINDGTNYVAVLEAGAYGLAAVDVEVGLRVGSWPLIAGITRPGKMLHVDIYIRNTPLATYQKQLAQWFDPEDETPKPLVGEDVGGANDRYVMGICVELAEVPFSAGLHYVASIQVHGDIRWREISPSSDSWSITASGQTKVLTNNGQDDAYPGIRIKPTSSHGVGFTHKRFATVEWKTELSAINYPVDITNNGLDTDALETAGKVRSDLGDLRVFVDGVEVDRWCWPATDDPTTAIWINLDFVGNPHAPLAHTLGANMTSGQDFMIIDFPGYVEEDISYWPTSGIVKCENEIMTYTGKNNQTKMLTGLTRGAKGTTAAAHTASASQYVKWIQHDVWIYYGSNETAPIVDDNLKPMFLLSSTNETWDYNDFYDERAPARPGSWIFDSVAGTPEKYGGNHGVAGNPYGEIGMRVNTGERARWSLTNPCGLVEMVCTNGEYWQYIAGDLIAETQRYLVGSGWITDTVITTSVAASWTAWSETEAEGSGPWPTAWGIYGSNPSGGFTAFLECSDVAMTMLWEPAITMEVEISNYGLSCTIENQTTGDMIEVDFEMELNEYLNVDSDEKTVVYEADNSNQFNALDLTGGPRRDWLPLIVGANTFRFIDVSTGNVTIGFTWDERSYQ